MSINQKEKVLNIAWPSGLGSVLAIIVLVLVVLGLVGVLPATPPVLFGLIGALAVARLT